MGKLEKYSSYKDSGVEWLGEIPQHWETKKMKYITKFISGFPFNSQKFDEYDGINVVRIGDIKDTIDLSKCMKSLEKKIHKNTIIKKNDTLVALSGATTGKSCFIYENIEETYINQRIAKFNYSNSFLYYCISNEKFKKDILLGADGSAQENVSNTTIENMLIPFPTNEEQIKIASFLDDKIAQIDNAISQKEKLIELLKEQKQITINEAVTKGLDKDVEFVDSGVEWIGKIPKHWEIEKLKSYCKAYGRIGFRGYTTSDLVNENEGAITISPSNIFEYSMKFEKCSFLSWEKYYESPEIQIEENDILIVKTGSTFGKIGMVKNLPEKATINPQLLVLKNIKIQKRFFYYMLISIVIQTQMNKQVIGSTIPTISENKILNFISLIPPKQEQLQIVEYIENQTIKIDKAIKLQQNYILKLKEYKASLIDSVVTGKVRVV